MPVRKPVKLQVTKLTHIRIIRMQRDTYQAKTQGQIARSCCCFVTVIVIRYFVYDTILQHMRSSTRCQ